MTVNLADVVNAQTLTLTLTGLSDSAGRDIPDTTVSVSFLAGDVNADGVVNSGDATLVRNRSGRDLDEGNFRCDVNADGSINSGDALLVRGRSGSFIP